MTSHSITVSFKPASERGALNGFEAKCSCGYKQGTSLGEREAERDARDHLAWAARKEG